MPVELSIVESVTELSTTIVEVVLESASEPGPAGPGVLPGGTTGQALLKSSNTDFDTEWGDVGGAPSTADYLVGTAQAGLSAEIVVGATPGGELGGTWASPTVDATHSGSSHAGVQAAAEATAAAALAAHEADTTSIHGIANTANLETTAGAQAKVDTHVNDTSDAHDASAISFTPAGTIAATDVQAAIEEVASEAGGGGAPTDVDYLVGTASGGLSAEIVVGTTPGGELGGTWASPTVDATHSGSSHAGVQAAAEATAAAALDAHVTDATAAHAASAISYAGNTGLSSTDVEAALDELDNEKQPLDADLTAIAALTTDAAGRGLLTLTDPNADRIVFWDDSLGAYTHLTAGTNLTITGTTLDASGGAATADDESLVLHVNLLAI